MKNLIAISGLLLLAACNASEDNPTRVHDLRLLDVQLEAPELMADSCTTDPSNTSALIAFSQNVKFTALIADPAGAGRDIQYDVRACAWPGDRKCDSDTDSVAVKSGTTTEGELTFDFHPGTFLLPKRNNEPLLEEVVNQDTYKGLGGIRLPIVLHLKAGDEEIYATKLMVFSCKFFPEMNANVTPIVPGLTLEGDEWDPATPRALSGPGPFKILPDDFADRQEEYTVPSFELKPVHLKESWKIAWLTTEGRMSRSETGGTDVDGTENRHNVEWVPTSAATAGEVTFYAVVRDGRGGTSWLIRKVQYTP
ncbi:MAG: hypothetical protein ACJ790_21800 [Myxococcaceae bacterium]